MTNVVFWERFKGEKPERTSYICFSPIYGGYGGEKTPISIRYLAKVSKKLTLEQIHCYLGFLCKFLVKDDFRYKVLVGDVATQIMFVLKTEHMEHSKALLYLTAFRYVDEYPEIVMAFYKRCKDMPVVTNENIWKVFQTIHSECLSGTMKTDAGNLYGHGLMSGGYGCPFDISLKLTTFLRRLVAQRHESVQSYFRV